MRVTQNNFMIAYIVLGAFTIVAALGGMKKLFKEVGIGGLISAVLLSFSALLSLVGVVRVGVGLYLSIGGVLLVAYAFALLIYKRGIGQQLFIIYASLLVGIAFYAVQKGLYGVELAGLTRDTAVVYAVLVLIIGLLSTDAGAAFIISVLTVMTASSLFYARGDSITHTIFGGDAYENAVLVLSAAMFLSYYVRRMVYKLYPKPKELLFEVAEEIMPGNESKPRK